jgi:hypothetical protein
VSLDAPRTLAPSAGATTRLGRMLAPTATLSGLALATLALHLRDPHETGTWGLCPSAAVLGIYCPGCGGLRAVNDLTNGDLAAAASSNLVLVAVLPFALVALVVWAVDRWRGKTRHPSWQVLRPGVLAFIGVLVVFTVLRNLTVGAWLAP